MGQVLLIEYQLLSVTVTVVVPSPMTCTLARTPAGPESTSTVATSLFAEEQPPVSGPHYVVVGVVDRCCQCGAGATSSKLKELGAIFTLDARWTLLEGERIGRFPER